MAHLKNSPGLFLDALGRRPTVRRPIWFMRQAGRYLPEYNQVRKKAGSFLALCKNPKLACEVTLQPVERFDLDAAIIFSDILTVPDAMGLGLEFVDGEGPKFARPLRDEKDIFNLAVPVPEETLDYVMETVRLCRQKLAGQMPLIGFSGSPFTLACYMVEGGSPGEFFHIKSLRYTRPQLLHHLLKINAEAVAAYLCAQINCGAQVAMIFDTWGGVLSQEDFAEFSLPYLTQVLVKVKNKNPHVPCIVFVKGGGGWLEMQTQTGADVLGVDWSLPLSQARVRVGDKVALQGNLDPLSLMGTATEVKKQTLRVLDSFGQGPGHIFNLGHGIHRLTPLANVEIMVKTVKEYEPV